MRTFYLVLTVLVFLLLQAVLADRIAIGPVAPDFVLLVVLFFALYRGSVRGAIFGFIVGFLEDLGNPEYLGLNALVKSVMGFLVGEAGRKTFPDNAFLLFGLFAAAALGHDIVYLFVYHWPHVGSAFLRIFTEALPCAAYTALLGTLVDRVAAMFGARVVTPNGKEG
jgi:rod shape-determining protein MreD